MRIKRFFVEDIRSARRFLKAIDRAIDIDQIEFILVNEHTKDQDLNGFIQYLISGEDMGVISEAGLPCVADPGSRVVDLAHALNIRVVPLVGPNSMMMALMASGFNGQRFAFQGYLPVDRGERARALKDLENRAYKIGETQIFMEAPYRNMQMLETICKELKPQTMLSVSVDISLPTEEIFTCSVGDWKKRKPSWHKRPAVFVISK